MTQNTNCSTGCVNYANTTTIIKDGITNASIIKDGQFNLVVGQPLSPLDPSNYVIDTATVPGCSVALTTSDLDKWCISTSTGARPQEEDKKESKNMNFFKNFEFGPVKNDAVRLSPYGLAVKNLDGSWVSYDGSSDSIIDVDVFNFEGKNLIYKIPAAPHTIRTGDMIIHQGKAMYVVANVEEGDTCVSVIDPRAGESKEILFTKSPFGFTFVIKLVSLLDMSGISANPDSPFGNLLPLALMGDKDCDAATMMAFMMMTNSEDCGLDMSHPMMMYALMSGDDKDMLLPMLLMAGRK